MAQYRQLEAMHDGTLITLTYGGVEGYGKVRYQMRIRNDAKVFYPPPARQIRSLSRRLNFELYTEKDRKRSHNTTAACQVDVTFLTLPNTSIELRSALISEIVKRVRFK